MKTLSVVLATYNEEKNLPKCLDSLKDIADEIVIVDGSSSDKTVEIAKEYGAKVKVTTNKPNFHINKQMAIDMATKDWILQMDADEHVSKELKEDIIKVLKEKDGEFNGYWMPRKNYFLGRFLLKGGQYPDYTLRFYKKGKGKLPMKDVHEQAEVQGKIGYFKGALLHYPYKNFWHYLEKWDLYNDLLSAQIKKEQEKNNFFKKIFFGIDYLLIKPIYWFFLSFIRHKGFIDIWSGFVFSLFSSLRFPASYLKHLGGFKIGVFLILFFAFAIRLNNFPNRWSVTGDDGRDAIIGLEALKRGELPLIGSFSSAGPFVFGPLFYWIVMFSYLLFPWLISAPWLITGIVGGLTVAVFIYCGYLIGGKRLAIFTGILAATSPQLVVRSLILGQHTYVSTFSALVILSFLLLWKRKKQFYAFLMGLSLGIAVSMHYQALNYLIFFIAIFFINSLSFTKRIWAFLLMFLGFLIPSLPLLYWDSFQNFANLRNILDYFLVSQYRIYVPNSWTLYLFNYFPNYWGFVVGRYTVITLILMFLSAIMFLYTLIRRKLSRPVFILGTIFFILFFLGRFYKGERSESYLLYYLPLILIFTSWFIDRIYSLSSPKIGENTLKYLAILFLLILASVNSVTNRNLLTQGRGELLRDEVRIFSEELPNAKFTVYDYKYLSYSDSAPVSLFLDWNDLEDKNGIPIGVGCLRKDCMIFNYPIIATIGANSIYDLSGVANFPKNKNAWINMNSENIYDDLIGWSKKHELRSTFSLKNYIMDKTGWKL